MKIFISHSSKNVNYGNTIVQLLKGIEIKCDQIIFTSNPAYGIPTGQNIFNWLKTIINEKPYVIYLLSPEYYDSIACLNEMGATWIIENQHTMIFTPNFKIDSYEFQNSVLDSREKGFFIDNEDELTSFIESLRKSFEISTNQIIINQQCKEFLEKINTFHKPSTTPSSTKETTTIVKNELKYKSEESIKPNISQNNPNSPVKKYFNDLNNEKLKCHEVLIMQYVIDTSRYKLRTGWQAIHEEEEIKEWEKINDLDSTLSQNYKTVIRNLEMRKLIEASKFTEYNNPKEYKFIEEMQEKFLDLPQEFHNKVSKIKEVCKKEQIF